MDEISEEIKAQMEEKLEEGILYRTSHLALFCAIAFLFFGLYTHQYFAQYAPDLTIFDNVWPRFIFNSIPFLACYFLLQNRKVKRQTRLVTWYLSFPLLLHAASWINCWPLIMKGHVDVFHAVHTQNIYIISIWFLYAAPNVKRAVPMLATFAALFCIPMFFVLRAGVPNTNAMSIFVNDTALAMVYNFFIAKIIFRLRYKLAYEDVKNKIQTERFVGKRVAEAIFERKDELFDEFSRDSLVMALDLRGFTSIVLKAAEADVSQFINEYHKIVSDVVGRYGGYLHKSSGDGHLITFGLMDDLQDLDDIPELADRVDRAEATRVASLFRRSNWMIAELVDQLLACRERPNFKSIKPKLGIGISYGKVAARIVGDKKYRQELDIHGVAIIQAVRLEAFTKDIINKDANALAVAASSVSVHPQVLEELCYQNHAIGDAKVKDFETIGTILVKKFLFPTVKEDAA